VAEGGIGSVSVEVVPAAERFWRRFEQQTRAGAAAAGERSRSEFDRTFSRGPATVRVRADTTEARAQMAALNRQANSSSGVFEKLVKTAITLAPAAVPIAAAAGAAAAEFGALGVTAALTLKGLKADLQGAGKDAAGAAGLVDSLKASVNDLARTSAHGALPGLAEATEKLHAALPGVNAELSTQAQVLGEVTSHLAGGLVGGFQTFAPLLSEVAGSVDRIAAKFETWATGPGGAKLGQTLEQDYARVAPIIDDIAQAVVHVVEAAHTPGLGILTSLGLLSRVVEDFPTPALEAIIAGFVSFRTINALSGVISTFATGVQSGYARLTASSVASAAATEAANLQVAASAATEAAVIAESQARAAAAYAAAQLEIAQATVGTEAALSGLAAASVAAATEQATAAAAAAEAAAASAAEIGAAAELAAAESTAAAEAASFSWSAMLGPVGIAVGAVALLGISFLGTSDDTQRATGSLQDYTQALVQSHGAIDSAVRERVASNTTLLGDVDEIRKAGLTLGVVVDDITNLKNPTLETIDAITKAFHSGKISRREWEDLLTDIHGQGVAFKDASVQAGAESAALTHVSAAVSQQSGLLHTNAGAFLAARDAAKKSTEQAQAQTVQWQVENSAGRLLAETLDKLAGKSLSFAQAENQFQSQLVTMAQALQQGGKGLQGLSSDAIQNRANLLQLVQGAQQTAEAYGEMTGSSLKGRKELIKLRQQIIDNAVAHGEDRSQVEKYIDSVLKIPTKAGTEITLKDAQAKAEARALQRYIKSLDWAVNVQAKGSTVTAKGGIHIGGLATGGGLPEGWAAVGERGAELVHKSGPVVQVFSHQQSKRIVASSGMRAPGFAGGTGGPGDVVSISQSDSKAPKAKKGPGPTYTVAGQSYSSLQAAENAAKRLFKAQVALGVRIDDKDLTSFRPRCRGRCRRRSRRSRRCTTMRGSWGSATSWRRNCATRTSTSTRSSVTGSARRTS
jgi:hypothetical protein